MEDTRCCGSGVCIISADGECWCGQRWDGEKMCRPPLEPVPTATGPGVSAQSSPAAARPGEAP